MIQFQCNKIVCLFIFLTGVIFQTAFSKECLKSVVFNKKSLEFELWNSDKSKSNRIRKKKDYAEIVTFNRNILDYQAVISSKFFILSLETYKFMTNVEGSFDGLQSCPVLDSWHIHFYRHSSNRKYFYFSECEAGGCDGIQVIDRINKIHKFYPYDGEGQAIFALHKDSGPLVTTSFENLTYSGSGESPSAKMKSDAQKAFKNTKHRLFVVNTLTGQKKLLPRRRVVSLIQSGKEMF